MRFARKTSAREVFARIKREIGYYYGWDILDTCIEMLNRPDAHEIERVRTYRPWAIILIAKWTLIFGSFVRTSRQSRMTVQSFAKLVMLLDNLEELVKRPSDHPNAIQFIRKMAVQQFWWQAGDTPGRLARQSLLFGQLPINHALRTAFVSVTEIDIEDFTQMSIALISFVLRKGPRPNYITSTWFSSLEPTIGKDSIRRFLDSLSMEISDLGSFLRKGRKSSDIDLELYEQTPLIRYPMIRETGEFEARYHLLSPVLVCRSLETYIYDWLVDSGQTEFAKRFGEVFQSYVESGLRSVGADIVPEARLRQVFGEDSRVVDYLVRTNDECVLVDAKSSRLSYLNMLADDDVLPGGRAKAILSGIEQGYAVARRLLEPSTQGSLQVQSSNCFLVLVTYKEYYLGNGTFLSDGSARLTIERSIVEYGGANLPIGHIFVVSIDDWDLLLECSRLTELSLSDILRQAVADNTTSATAKLVLGQHLRNIAPNIGTPTRLTTELDRILASLGTRLGEN